MQGERSPLVPLTSIPTVLLVVLSTCCWKLNPTTSHNTLKKKWESSLEWHYGVSQTGRMRNTLWASLPARETAARLNQISTNIFPSSMSEIKAITKETNQGKFFVQVKPLLTQVQLVLALHECKKSESSRHFQTKLYCETYSHNQQHGPSEGASSPLSW